MKNLYIVQISKCPTHPRPDSLHLFLKPFTSKVCCPLLCSSPADCTNTGLQVYLASSGIIRHTMIALYSDLSVKTTKLVINTPPSIPLTSDHGKRRISRDKSFRLLQVVTGISRVSGKVNEWEMYVQTFPYHEMLVSSPFLQSIHIHFLPSYWAYSPACCQLDPPCSSLSCVRFSSSHPWKITWLGTSGCHYKRRCL